MTEPPVFLKHLRQPMPRRVSAAAWKPKVVTFTRRT